MEEVPKLSKSILDIPGTRPSIQNSQLLTSSGIPSLDELLGGGLPVGTVVLVEEDQQGSYAKIILKYFLAEGIVNQHSVFIASQDTSTNNIMQELPDVISFDPEPDASKVENDTKMKIAFRYQNLPTSEKGLHIGHHYDLTRPMPRENLEQADIVHWNTPKPNDQAPKTFSNSHYHYLLESIKQKIQDGHFNLTDKAKKRSILRIGLHAVGSPMWLDLFGQDVPLNPDRDLSMFIFCLRALVRMSLTVAVVTIPSHLLERAIVDRCIYSSDIAIKLKSFEGTELERNPVLSDYQGYFQLLKLAAINTFASKHPGSAEYVFKLRRRKFGIEKLHLPPGFSESGSKDPISAACGSSTKHLLEF